MSRSKRADGGIALPSPEPAEENKAKAAALVNQVIDDALEAAGDERIMPAPSANGKDKKTPVYAQYIIMGRAPGAQLDAVLHIARNVYRARKWLDMARGMLLGAYSNIRIYRAVDKTAEMLGVDVEGGS